MYWQHTLPCILQTMLVCWQHVLCCGNAFYTAKTFHDVTYRKVSFSQLLGFFYLFKNEDGISLYSDMMNTSRKCLLKEELSVDCSVTLIVYGSILQWWCSVWSSQKGDMFPLICFWYLLVRSVSFIWIFSLLKPI